VRDLVHGIVSVPERELRRAVADLAAEEHLIVEGAAAVGVAAVSAGRLPDPARTAVVLTGANIDTARLADVLTS
jgi:threonine dehydratase